MAFIFMGGLGVRTKDFIGVKVKERVMGKAVGELGGTWNIE